MDFDEIKATGDGRLSLRGYGMVEGMPTLEQRVYCAVTDQTGTTRLYLANIRQRDDFAPRFGEESRFAGFFGTISLDGFIGDTLEVVCLLEVNGRLYRPKSGYIYDIATGTATRYQLSEADLRMNDSDAGSV